MSVRNISLKNGSTGTSFFIYASAFAAVLIWSFAPAIMKMSLSHMDLTSLLLTRFIVSSFIFIPTLKSVITKINDLNLKNWLIFCTIVSVIYFLQMAALKNFPVSWYLIIFSLNPILSLIFMKIDFNRKVLISIAIAILGTALFLDFKDLTLQISLTSWLLMIGGMLAWVGYSSFLPVMQKSYSDSEITALTSFVGLLSTGTVWLINGFSPLSFDKVGIISSISLGVLFPLAYFLFSLVIRHKPVFGIVSQYLEPVFGIAIAYCFLGETLQWSQLLGASLIVGSMGYLAKNL